MQAYFNDPAVKAKYVKRMRQHRLADEVVHRIYWRGGKGCAVGCTVHSDDHHAFERELGIPEELAYLEEALFEGLSGPSALDFPLAFLQAIPVGADLSQVKDRLMLWLLTDEQEAVQQHGNERTRELAARMAALARRSLAGEPLPTAWEALEMEVRRHANDMLHDETGAARIAASALYMIATDDVQSAYAQNAQSFQRIARQQGEDTHGAYEEALCRTIGTLLTLLAAAPVPVTA